MSKLQLSNASFDSAVAQSDSSVEQSVTSQEVASTTETTEIVELADEELEAVAGGSSRWGPAPVA